MLYLSYIKPVCLSDDNLESNPSPSYITLGLLLTSRVSLLQTESGNKSTTLVEW